MNQRICTVSYCPIINPLIDNTSSGCQIAENPSIQSIWYVVIITQLSDFNLAPLYPDAAPAVKYLHLVRSYSQIAKYVLVLRITPFVSPM